MRDIRKKWMFLALAAVMFWQPLAVNVYASDDLIEEEAGDLYDMADSSRADQDTAGTVSTEEKDWLVDGLIVEDDSASLQDVPDTESSVQAAGEDSQAYGVPADGGSGDGSSYETTEESLRLEEIEVADTDLDEGARTGTGEETEVLAETEAVTETETEGLIEEEQQPEEVLSGIAVEEQTFEIEDPLVVDPSGAGASDTAAAARRSAARMLSDGTILEDALENASGVFTTMGDQLSSDSRRIYDARVNYYYTGRNTGNLDITFTRDEGICLSQMQFKKNDDGKWEMDQSSELYKAFYEMELYTCQAAADALNYDYPEIFWTRKASFTVVPGVIVYTNGTGYAYLRRLTIKPIEAFPGAKGLISQYDAGVSEAVSSIRASSDYDQDGSLSVYEILQGIHDYLCDRLWYDSASLASYSSTGDYRIFTSAGAFVDSVGQGVVCEGYARSFKVLCDQFGIPCTTVGGRASASAAIGHMWDEVEINGIWYLIDPTWDDRGTDNGRLRASKTYYLCGLPSGRIVSGLISGAASSVTTSSGTYTLNKQTFTYPALGADAHSFVAGSTFTNEAEDLHYTEYRCSNGEGSRYWVNISGYSDEGICTVCGRINLAKVSGTAVSAPDVVFSGDAQTPVTVSYQENVLQEGTDYSITYEHNIDAGTASALIRGIGHYAGTLTCTFAIEKASLTEAALTMSSESYAYNGLAQKPDVSLIWKNRALTEGKDYSVIYPEDCTHVGTVTIAIIGMNNFEGALIRTYAITPASVTAAVVTLAQRRYSYTGAKIIPSLTVTSGGRTLTYGTDYTFSCENNVNAGTALVTVAGIGGYTGTVRASFTIARADLSGASVKVSNAVYNGKSRKPSVTVTVNGAALRSGTDYTVTYKNNKQIGKASATITGKGNYTGKKKASFTITPAAATLTKAKQSGSRAICLKWKKVSGITGYQIQYAQKKTFSGAKAVYIRSASTTSRVISGLKSGKTYYVRIRAYKKVRGKYYYGAWSARKRVKTK